MFSLGNAFDDDEFLAWHKRVSDLLDGEPFDMVCELKYDGLAVALAAYREEIARSGTSFDSEGASHQPECHAERREVHGTPKGD